LAWFPPLNYESNPVNYESNPAMIYYQHVRREIRPLLPPKVSQILDVGAGVGATLRWLKSIYPEATTTGLELNPALKLDLEKNADIAIIGDIRDCFQQLSEYDLILCLDVLEHLTDSVDTLKTLSTRLRPAGHVIVSVPNIAHLSVSVPLLLRRRFAYQDAGILDRTHLRFFVEATAIDLLNEAGFRVTNGMISGVQGPRAKFLDRVSFGLLRHYLAKQYIMLGELTDHKTGQQKVGWLMRQ
jgi:SAM-dependent methyltransferase